jgi:hypothetical protein
MRCMTLVTLLQSKDMKKVTTWVPDLSGFTEWNKPCYLHLKNQFIESLGSVDHPLSQLVPGFNAKSLSITTVSCSSSDCVVVLYDARAHEAFEVPKDYGYPARVGTFAISPMLLVVLGFEWSHYMVPELTAGMAFLPVLTYKEYVERTMKQIEGHK